ncbi:MAG: hypothetical protein QW039_00270 [Fervidicoccaceae archaeon]
MKNSYSEERIDCPICHQRQAFVIRSLIYDLPSQGKTLILSGKCEVCGYRFTFTTPFEVEGSRLLEFKVERAEDLNVLIYVGENTDIEIPEFEFQFLSSDYEPGFVTTIEGLLVRIIEKMEILCNEQSCYDKLDLIKRSMNGELEFTLRLIDRYGKSGIISDRVMIKKMEI